MYPPTTCPPGNYKLWSADRMRRAPVGVWNIGIKLRILRYELVNYAQVAPPALHAAPNFGMAAPPALHAAPNFGGKRSSLFQVPCIKKSNPECKSCKMSNSRTFSPESGSAPQRRGRNSRKIYKLGFSKFAELNACGGLERGCQTPKSPTGEGRTFLFSASHQSASPVVSVR